MMKKNLLFILCYCLSSSLFAQFDINGNATNLGGDCYRLTGASTWQAGSIWNTQQLNLNESFDLRFNINLGTIDDNGADGLVFALQPISTSIGENGGGLGIQGVTPSLVVEFDTYLNGDFNDPAADHMALIRDGDLNHNSANNLDGPVNISTVSANVENGQDYAVKIIWNSSTQTINIYVNCQLRLSYTGNIVNDIFGGNPQVFWGFTAATGGLFNVQQVCITETLLNTTSDVVAICTGESTQLNAAGGVSYSWTPNDATIDDATSATPTVSPTSTTTYTVEITDNCGLTNTKEVEVVVNDVPDADLGADQVLCMGETITLNAENAGYDYLWSTGQTGQTIDVSTANTYGVTVTNENCIDSDEIVITSNTIPTVSIGEDITICEGEATTLIATGFNTDSYTWSTGETSNSISVNTTGNYSVEVENECGTGTDDIDVGVEVCECVVKFPSAFSPNNDGKNDVFAPIAKCQFQSYDLKIFNRWGELVFTSTNPSDSWNGQQKETSSPMETYVWVVKYQGNNDSESTTKQGDILLIK